MFFQRIGFTFFRIIVFHNQESLTLNFVITSVSLHHYVSTKIEGATTGVL